MNPLPLISHHLFVEAIRGETDNTPTPAQRPAVAARSAEGPRTVPLEVMDNSEPMPVDASRPLRTSLALGGT